MHNNFNSLLYEEDQILGLITLHVTVKGADFVVGYRTEKVG